MNQQTSIISVNDNQYRGVSQIINKKKDHQAEFHDRFKGKTTLMSKEGHIGVVQSTLKPISKNALG